MKDNSKLDEKTKLTSEVTLVDIEYEDMLNDQVDL